MESMEIYIFRGLIVVGIEFCVGVEHIVLINLL